MEHRPSPKDGLANTPVLAIAALAAGLVALAPASYERVVQEDGLLEWTTFWAFAIAAVASARGAVSVRTESTPHALFRLGLAGFCAFVALEEISWGQRLFGYRPPDYFLAENAQQELNLHNTLGGDFRQLGFLAVALGYGVVAPLALRAAALERIALRLGVEAPPLAMIPAFAVTGGLYWIYPWDHTGEWAEAMLGLAMLQSIVWRRPAGFEPMRSAAILVLAIGLAGATVIATSALSKGEPEKIADAERELDALRHDLGRGRGRTRCGTHRRVYTQAEAARLEFLEDGAFAALGEGRADAERFAFFLDPWESPYWVRHTCSNDRRRRAIFVYSFGPDRRRDSTEWSIEGDDLGAWIIRPSPAPSTR